jgi:hypothetical protein
MSNNNMSFYNVSPACFGLYTAILVEVSNEYKNGRFCWSCAYVESKCFKIKLLKIFKIYHGRSLSTQLSTAVEAPTDNTRITPPGWRWHIILDFFVIKPTAVPSWSCSKAVYKPVWHIPLLSVQWINSWWWTDELSKTRRVSRQNKFVKSVHIVGLITKINLLRCTVTQM